MPADVQRGPERIDVDTASSRTVAVFGGTGFLGGAIVARLAASGAVVRVAVRHPKGTEGEQVAASGGRVEHVHADIRDEAAVGRALEGCVAGVNAVGLYAEKGDETFHAIHEEGARHVARQSARAGISCLVHVSGIGANLQSASKYVRSRARGEKLVRDEFPDAVILRPSVLFGPDDKFLNTLIAATKWSPVVALFGKGETRLQPVHVADVAEAAFRVLTLPDKPGNLFELGGPTIYRYRDLIALVLAESRRRRLLVPVPFAAWEAMARVLMWLPKPPLTTDVVTLMKSDNVVGKEVMTFADLDIVPTGIDVVLRSILQHRPESG